MRRNNLYNSKHFFDEFTRNLDIDLFFPMGFIRFQVVNNIPTVGTDF